MGEILGALAFAVAFLGIQPLALATPHVRVDSAARIEAHAIYAGGHLRLEGTLADDANVPLEDESVSVSLSTIGADRGALRLSRCDRAKADSTLSDPTAGISLARTDTGGRFCASTTMTSPQRCVAHFAWHGTPLIEGVAQDLAIDPSLSTVELSFDPEPTVVSLEQAPFGFDAVAAFADRATASPPSGLALTLTNELGTELGQGTTDASGRVRLVLVPARAGPPGKGELRVSFGGDRTTGPASHAAEIERRARISLSVPGAERDILPPGTPDESVSVIVFAKTPSGEPVPQGSIEARVEGSPVGAATIRNGRATLILRFSAEEQTVSEIHLRYVANGPWYESGDELLLRLPVIGPSLWRRVPLVVAGLGVVAWLSFGRAARAPSLRRGPVLRPQPSPSIGARVTVIHAAARDMPSRWTGRVVDAHDATPLPRAEVAIVRYGLQPSDPLRRATTDETGRFELRCDEVRKGDELTVSSRLHATLRRSAPPFGEIEIALVLRRRALLDRLVAWARMQGAPFDTETEPTPRQVAHTGAGTDLRASRWARNVECAAFGPEEVDARVERDAEEGSPLDSSGSIGAPRHLEKDNDDTPR